MLKQLLWDWRYIIILAIAFAVYAAFEWQKVKTKSYALMLQAKSLAKDAVLKSGKQQEEWVVKKAYQFLPRSITIFISEENMGKMIHYLYSKAKDYLDDGELNKSIE
jgi:hypothetical protein